MSSALPAATCAGAVDQPNRSDDVAARQHVGERCRRARRRRQWRRPACVGYCNGSYGHASSRSGGDRHRRFARHRTARSLTRSSPMASTWRSPVAMRPHLSEARRPSRAPVPPPSKRFAPTFATTPTSSARSPRPSQRFGGLDILVNNAGVGVFANVADMTPKQWSEVIDTNLTGVFNTCHAALPHLKQRGGGYIINISSLAGKNAFAGAAAYCASKSGLNAFSEALMQEVRYDNIRVSYIMPGSVATGFSGGDRGEGSGLEDGLGGCRRRRRRRADVRSAQPSEPHRASSVETQESSVRLQPDQSICPSSTNTATRSNVTRR